MAIVAIGWPACLGSKGFANYNIQFCLMYGKLDTRPL